MRKLLYVMIGLNVGIFTLAHFIEKPEAQSQFRMFQPWTVEADMAAVDTTISIVPALGATSRRYVTSVSCTVITAAAVTIDIESSDGAVEVLKIPASGTGQWRTQLDNGIALPFNTGLRIQPSAAGAVLHCVAEGYVRGVS